MGEEDRRQRLKERAAEFPDSPGVYLFRDAAGEVLYVGKAISLRNRVRSYFSSPSSLNTRTMRMLAEAVDIDFLLTDSEVEALIFEADLIKRHRPRFNVRLRDDKQYPYIVVTTGDDYPRVGVARRVERDEHRYFGPFTNTSLLRRAMELLRKVFPYRTCTDYVMEHRQRPCLHYHVGRCLAPCTRPIDPGEYDDVIDGLLGFLGGRSRELTRDLEARMEEAAAELDFERAARIRDQIDALKTFREQQRNLSAPSAEDMDVLGLARRGESAAITLLFMREGRIVGNDGFIVGAPEDTGDGEILGDTLVEYYSHSLLVPRRILLPVDPPDSQSLERWLGENRGSRVFLHRPERGEKRRLVALANRNAELLLDDEAASSGSIRPLGELEEILELPAPPIRIECYDISNLSGSSAVGSMVVFEDGHPAPYGYRRFRIKDVDEIDDYAMMREVLSRRARRLDRSEVASQVAEDTSFSAVPDLIVIDGGPGHVATAREALAETPLEGTPILGIAKREELLYRPGESVPLTLPDDSDALKLLRRIRDEAHRFALDYHRRLRSKGAVRSLLDDIPGVGPRRRNALLAHFTSIEAMTAATEEELAAVPGMTRRAARSVKRFLVERAER